MSDNTLETLLSELIDNPNPLENITTVVAELSICNIFKSVPEEIISSQLADATVALAKVLNKDSSVVMDITARKGDELLKEWNKDEETRSTFIEYVNTKYVNRSKMH